MARVCRRPVLALVAAAMLSSWCDAECVERAHPLFNRWRFGAPELSWTMTVVPRSPRLHRFQLAWAYPLLETLEVFGGAALASDGRFELVPGARFAPARVGFMLVPALAVSAPMSLSSAGVLELHVRPALEAHVAFAAMQLALDVDVAGRAPLSFWVGCLLSL
jgi:hypothetical protein